MKTVLHQQGCYVPVANVEVREGERQFFLPGPRLPIVPAEIAHIDGSNTPVNIDVLLDTGNDITIIKPDKIRELEQLGDVMVPEARKILYWGESETKFEPAFDVALVLNGEHLCMSNYGFIAPSPGNRTFDIADAWLGQDVLNQLIVTFDGIQDTVTIQDPKER